MAGDMVGEERDHRASVVAQARSLSSGTLATLTGKSLYSEIDPIYAEFVDFCEEVQNHHRSWQSAWHAYARSKGYAVK